MLVSKALIIPYYGFISLLQEYLIIIPIPLGDVVCLQFGRFIVFSLFSACSFKYSGRVCLYNFRVSFEFQESYVVI